MANNHFVSGYSVRGLILNINLEILGVGVSIGELPLPPVDMNYLCGGPHLGEATGERSSGI